MHESWRSRVVSAFVTVIVVCVAARVVVAVVEPLLPTVIVVGVVVAVGSRLFRGPRFYR